MRAWAVAAALVVVGCRSLGPGAPLAPLTASSADEALAQLHARAASFKGARSMMRVRATRSGETRSFRAQLVVAAPSTMELIAYTPVGTAAMTIRAEGDRISYQNHLDGTRVTSTAEDLARSLGFYTAELKPYEMAMLLLGLPPRVDLAYESSATGLARATVADVSVTFDPPAFPAQKVVVTRGADILEVEHLETIATK